MAFVVLLVVLLLVDLLVVNRKAHVIKLREAAITSSIWISIGLAFTFVMWSAYGGEAAGEYIGAYLIEKSLSVDNVFVWAVILTHFKVEAQYQHRVLFWGIFGALVMRLGFIMAGVAVIEKFDFALILFGLFLVWTAWGLIKEGDEEFDPESSRAMKLFHRVVPSTDQHDGQKLFTKVNGKRLATPLFAVIVLIELTDVLFAVDSVPAVLGVSRERPLLLACRLTGEVLVPPAGPCCDSCLCRCEDADCSLVPHSNCGFSARDRWDFGDVNCRLTSESAGKKQRVT